MCGRYTLVTGPEELELRFSAEGDLSGFAPRYNIAPSQELPVVVRGEEGNFLRLMHWGLVPSWAKDRNVGYKMINARAETVATKPSFREAFRQRRCLVPSTGFYEWKTVSRDKRGKPVKRATYFSYRGGEIFAFAGLWEQWQAPGADAYLSYSVITTDANPVVERTHSRMPVILPQDAEEVWLDPSVEEPEDLLELLRPCDETLLVPQQVGAAVNSVANDSSDCIAPSQEKRWEQGTLDF